MHFYGQNAVPGLYEGRKGRLQKRSFLFAAKNGVIHPVGWGAKSRLAIFTKKYVKICLRLITCLLQELGVKRLHLFLYAGLPGLVQGVPVSFTPFVEFDPRIQYRLVVLLLNGLRRHPFPIKTVPIIPLNTENNQITWYRSWIHIAWHGF